MGNPPLREADWIHSGTEGTARAKILGEADGYVIALAEADAGYRGARYEHGYAEFLYVLNGAVRNQGRVMETGDAWAAAAGSEHTDFDVQAPSTYLSIFRL